MGSPEKRGSPYATKSTLLRSPPDTPKSNSHIRLLSLTCAPASRRIRDQICSMGIARRLTRPVLMQFALWSPKWSIRSGQCVPSQWVSNVGILSRRRRLMATSINPGLNVVSGVVGRAVRKRDVLGPDWERSIVRCGVDMFGKIPHCTKFFSTASDAWNCHPCAHSPASRSLFSGTSAPVLISCQVGHFSKPRSAKNRRVDSSSFSAGGN